MRIEERLSEYGSLITPEAQEKMYQSFEEAYGAAFSDDELEELADLMESPIYQKFLDKQSAIAETLVQAQMDIIMGEFSDQAASASTLLSSLLGKIGEA